MNENGNLIDWKKTAMDIPWPCHDCGAIFGQLHLYGCDVEQCAFCGGQRLGYECAREDIDKLWFLLFTFNIFYSSFKNLILAFWIAVILIKTLIVNFIFTKKMIGRPT